MGMSKVSKVVQPAPHLHINKPIIQNVVNRALPSHSPTVCLCLCFLLPNRFRLTHFCDSLEFTEPKQQLKCGTNSDFNLHN